MLRNSDKCQCGVKLWVMLSQAFAPHYGWNTQFGRSRFQLSAAWSGLGGWLTASIQGWADPESKASSVRCNQNVNVVSCQCQMKPRCKGFKIPTQMQNSYGCCMSWLIKYKCSTVPRVFTNLLKQPCSFKQRRFQSLRQFLCRTDVKSKIDDVGGIFYFI